MERRAHIHTASLYAFVARSGETQTEIGRRASLTPAGIGDLISGRRAGTNLQVRLRLADALDVDVEAITCRCVDRQSNHKDPR